MRDTFSSYHPVINFLYFAPVITFSMFFTHPACLVISLDCAITYAVYRRGKKAVKFSLAFLLPTLAPAAIIKSRL